MIVKNMKNKCTILINIYVFKNINPRLACPKSTVNAMIVHRRYIL